jgi:hypothetical protein
MLLQSQIKILAVNDLKEPGSPDEYFFLMPIKFSVADPGPGSGDFLAPGSGDPGWKKIRTIICVKND